jgi:hypothetical protein
MLESLVSGSLAWGSVVPAGVAAGDLAPASAMSHGAQRTAGILLLTLVAVEYGGTFLLKVSRGSAPASDLQKSFFRAGHAHAGVLVVLGLVCQLLLDPSGLTGLARSVAGSGVPLAAILMPAGFFLSVTGRDVQRPNRLIALVWVGAAALAAGVVTLGVGLLR